MSTSSFWSGPVRGGAFSAEQDASWAGMTAAENLFRKTVAALSRGEEDKARRLATQAAQRPYDDFEGVWPGPAAAHFALFQLVTDEVEESTEDDHAWVDAFADVVSRVSGHQLHELRYLAAILSQDAGYHSIDGQEAARLRTLAGGVDLQAQPGDDVPEDERPDYVLELARLLRALAARFDEVRAGPMT